MLVGNLEKFKIPDKCPIHCRYHHMSEFRGEKCWVCPVFNCVPDSDGNCTLPADQFDSTIAKLWQEWFNTDMREDVWIAMNFG